MLYTELVDNMQKTGKVELLLRKLDILCAMFKQANRFVRRQALLRKSVEAGRTVRDERTPFKESEELVWM